MLRATFRLVSPKCYATLVRAQANGVAHNRRTLTISSGSEVHPHWQKLCAVLKPEEIRLAEVLVPSMNVPLNIKMYNTIIHELGKSGKADQAHQLLNHLVAMSEAEDSSTIRPDTISYTSVMTAYARQGRAIEAEKVLRRLLEQYESSRDPDLEPNVRSYCAVIDAWAKSGKRGCALRADQLLREMEQLAQMTQIDALQPNNVAVNAVINAWAKSNERNAAERAEEILHWTEELYQKGNIHVKPDTITYTSVINAYARVGKPIEAEKVLRLLLRNYYSSRDPDLAPSYVLFNATIDAWARSGNKHSFDKSQALLNEMKDLKQRGLRKLSPNEVTYGGVLRSLAIVQDVTLDRTGQVQELLEEMEERGVIPDEFCLSCAILACSKTEGSEKQRQSSLEVAKRIFQELNERFDPPNAASYKNFILACANGNDLRLLEQTYWDCCSKGLGQDKLILSAVKRIAPHLHSSS